MAPRSRKILKWLLGSLVALAVVIALLFATFGFIVGRVPEYRVQLQDWIGERSGLIVEFRTLTARLRMYGPELVFDDAVVRTPDRTRVLFTASRGSFGFDLWSSIANGRLTAGRFSLTAPEIALIRTREGKIQLLGQSALPEREIKPIELDQLPTGRFQVEQAVVSFRDEITGRGPWSLSGVNFELTRDLDSMRLEGKAELPKSLGKELRFNATAEGALAQSSQLLSTFDVQGEQLDLAGWADLLPDAWPAPESGHGALQVSGTLRGAELIQLSSTVDIGQLTLELPVWTTPLPVAQPLVPYVESPEATAKSHAAAPVTASAPTPEAAASEPVDETPPSQMLSYSRLAFGLHAQKSNSQWSVKLSDLDATRSDSKWQAKQLAARWSRDESGALKISGEADRIVLDSVWPLFSYLPESAGLAQLRAMRAQGALSEVSLSFVRSAPEVAPTYSMQATLEAVGFEPVLRVPGLTGLNGRVTASDHSGQIQLAGRKVEFALPRAFRDVLVADTADGTVTWQRDDKGLVVATDEFKVHGADGKAVARMNLLLPADGSSPVLDLFAQGEDLNVASTAKYVPADHLGPKTLEWFDQAFLGGRISTAEFQYKGPMRFFPFRKNEGTFIARARVHDATLKYQPDWPEARQLEAEVEFRNQGMHIRTTSGLVGNVKVTQAIADIADFRQNELVIKATAAGDLGDGLKFLLDSPIGPKLGDTFARLSGRGAMTADVNMDLPLRTLDDRQIDVTARFADATVSLQKVNPPVRNLTGELTVRNSLIAAADLRGQWMGGPLDVKIEPQGLAASQLEARGHAQATELPSMLGLPSWVKLAGETDWQMSMRLLSPGIEGSDKQSVRIESNLRGLAVALPEPAGKTAAQELPLQIALDFEPSQVMGRGSAGDLRALIRVRQTNGVWAFDRGGIRADAVTPALPGHRGLRIEGAIQKFVLDDWLNLRGNTPAPANNDGGDAKTLSDVLQAANVRIGEFQLFGYRWPDVRGVLQATQIGWRVDVSGNNAVGQVLVPEVFTGSQPLRATMERLVIEQVPKPEDVVKDKNDTPLDPRNLPNMQIYVSDFRLGQRSVGAVELKATRVPQGIRFDQASVKSDSVKGEAHGQWFNTVDGLHSTLVANIESNDVAATLRALSYTPFIEAKKGAIRADLSWRGGYDGNILEHASGAIAVDAETGQLVNLQPGAGRVLGLFSVGALPRRLALDFSDLTEKGLAFDTVHGDFELRDGNAYTSNLLLRGPAAEIGIAGRTGLGTRDYDQTAVVTGNLGASLPVAGALAGGPVVGAAVLLFSQVFKEPLKGITRGYYRITGPWDEPVVERIDAADAKAEVAEQKRESGGG